MGNEVKETMGQLLDEFDVIVEKLVKRMKQEFQPKEENDLKFLFQMHVERRQVVVLN